MMAEERGQQPAAPTGGILPESLAAEMRRTAILESPNVPTAATRRRPRCRGSQAGTSCHSSSLLQRPDEQQAIDADELKLLAQVLTEKYAEFEVHGQVTQINPGPVVTSLNSSRKPASSTAALPISSTTSAWLLKAESILIERMAGKSTVGIQVPNHNREIIWLRGEHRIAGIHGLEVEADDGVGQRHQMAAS